MFTSCFNYELITVGARLYTNRATSVNGVPSARPIMAPLTITCHVALHMSTKGTRFSGVHGYLEDHHWSFRYTVSFITIGIINSLLFDDRYDVK